MSFSSLGSFVFSYSRVWKSNDPLLITDVARLIPIKVHRVDTLDTIEGFKQVLAEAKEKGLKSVAFPAISTGVYRFPIDRACRIALESLRDYLKSDDSLNKIYLVCFDQDVFDQYNILM